MGESNPLHENSYLVAIVADHFRQARGAGPWSTENLPGLDSVWALKVLAVIDSWLEDSGRTPSAVLPSEPRAKCPRPDCDKPGRTMTVTMWCAEHSPTEDDDIDPLPLGEPARTPASTGKAGEG